MSHLKDPMTDSDVSLTGPIGKSSKKVTRVGAISRTNGIHAKDNGYTKYLIQWVMEEPAQAQEWRTESPQ